MKLSHLRLVEQCIKHAVANHRAAANYIDTQTADDAQCDLLSHRHRVKAYQLLEALDELKAENHKHDPSRHTVTRHTATPS